MTLLYDRRIRVEVAGLTVEDLRITFEIEREADATQNKGTVSIFNLAPANEERIYKRSDEIRVNAGYPETVALLYAGHVERVQRMRQQLARRTVIKLGDTVRRSGRENPRLGGVYSATLKGPVAIREIVRGIAAALELPFGPLDTIPVDATWTNWAFSGPASAAMSAALRRVKCTWYEDNGKIRINRPRPAGTGADLQSDGPTIFLSPDSGLIDRPIETDEGAGSEHAARSGRHGGVQDRPRVRQPQRRVESGRAQAHRRQLARRAFPDLGGTARPGRRPARSRIESCPNGEGTRWPPRPSALVIPANVMVCDGCRARTGRLPPEFVDLARELGFERPEKICIDCLTGGDPRAGGPSSGSKSRNESGPRTPARCRNMTCCSMPSRKPSLKACRSTGDAKL